MSIKKVATVLALSAATILPGFALAAPAASQASAPCVLKEHRVVKVQPLNVTERYGRGTAERLAGATVFIQAAPGLTAEWLQLTLQRHVLQMAGSNMPNCALGAKDLQVSVVSAGNGFAVKLSSTNADQAKEILRRAQLLVQ
ncbi:MAG TPA: hypothetical protein VFK05_17310 [Polyangiaceae bacterium]|nr:hypothetical protein [Polyangiaceae bacterium]